MTYLFKILFLFAILDYQAYASNEVGIPAGTSTTSASSQHSRQNQSRFIQQCTSRGISEQFCREATDPNPDSRGAFNRVYGAQQNFILMPPQGSWETGIQLLGIAQSLSAYGKVCEIRNWYRPEPYNGAVGGAGGSRHLNASAIDIEFCSVEEKNKALKAALAMRQRFGKPAGVGVYGEGSLVLHIDTSNRIYGPGMANIDYAVSRNEAFRNSVQMPYLGNEVRTAGVNNGGQGPAIPNGSFFRNIVEWFNSAFL